MGIASRTKDQNLEKMTFSNEKLKVNHQKLIHENGRLKEELKNANSRIESYSKAVNLLKANNSKLAEQADDLNDQQQSAQLSQQYNQSFQAISSGATSGSTYNGNMNAM